ncbi:MAG TPA: permease [Solirubrobacteraceae bacterium]|nr:permease [Solirubrobacteraceae bacterium]
MSSVLDVLWHGLRDAFLMGWEVWWALAFGFFISAVVQAWVPRERIERAMSGTGARPVAIATGLGAASSSCSYAAVAIAKSLFQKGASAASALAFQFASTNLVWELGLVLWVLIGWQFTLAEYIGGIVMIVLMALTLRLFVSRRLEAQAREHARRADSGHQHHTAGGAVSWRQRLTSVEAWSDVAHNFRGDWQMLYKEILLGFVLAGFIAQLGNGFFNSLFLEGSPPIVQTIWGAFIGPVIAVLSFVCSVGNVPLAAVLWSGGISFAGVMAFIFADLIVLPILLIYRKYYGTSFALRITALMFVTMVVAALIIDAVFSALGLIPTGARPTRADIFGSIAVNYKLFLNLAGLAAFAALFWLTARRGATDPVCRMKVDRKKAVIKEFGGETFYFCSTHCLHAFEADPGHFTHASHTVEAIHDRHEHHEPNRPATSRRSS